MSYYALSFENSDNTKEQYVLTHWSQCQSLMAGKQNIFVKKFQSRDQAQTFLESKKTPCKIQSSTNKTFHLSKTLTDEQRDIVQHIMNTEDNCFITGPAGTGKSYVVKEILNWLKCNNIYYGITGSTGASAVLIGGKTLHSFMGIGLGKKSAEEYIASMKATQKRKLCRLHTLIIDEISMISDELIDKIDLILRGARSKDKPFGDVRMIFIGDACQLPPVVGNYFFKSKVWTTFPPHMFQLTKLIRQSNDVEFQEMLMRLRWGTCNLEDYERLKLCKKKQWPVDSKIKPTRLYATNVDVDNENEEALSELISSSERQVQTYPMNFNGTTLPNMIQRLKQWANSCRIPESITVCEGTQIMVTWNIDTEQGIVNGTRGIIHKIHPNYVDIELMDGRILPINYISVEYDEPIDRMDNPLRTVVGIEYLPIRLAYALTIHKCQGVTLDCAEIYLGESIFQYGQAYTALSRVKNLESIKIIGLVKKAFRTHPEVLAFYQQQP